MASNSVGQLCRHWRQLRRRSQLDLSLDVGVSTRHLSFVETGRSKPSRELVLALGRHLEVPLREQNAMLLAAGFAPHYPETPIDDPAAGPVRAAIDRLLDAHQPFPGVAVDGDWNVITANAAAFDLVGGLPDHLLAPSINVYRVSLHPDGLAGRSTNVDEWAPLLLEQLRRTTVLTARPSPIALHDEVSSYPYVADLTLAPPTMEVLVPFVLERADGTIWSLFSTIATFGTPHDVTVGELAIELFFPADEATGTAIRAAEG